MSCSSPTATSTPPPCARPWRRCPTWSGNRLVLAYFGQLSHQEIANRLELPLGTVKARVFRGLRHLSAVLTTDETETR